MDPLAAMVATAHEGGVPPAEKTTVAGGGGVGGERCDAVDPQLHRRCSSRSLLVQNIEGEGEGDGGGGRIRDWGGCGFPSDLLHCIAEQLDFYPDLLSFSSTCKSWTSAGALSASSLLRCHFPLLMHANMDDKILKFFSISHNRGFKLQLPSAMGPKWCMGTSRGWLILMDRCDTTNVDGVAHLLNPFTGESLPLPPLSGANPRWMKAMLFNDPSKDDGFKGASSSLLTIVIDLRSSSVSFCRPGDDRWTVIRNVALGISGDLIFFRGRFYVVSMFDWVIRMYGFDATTSCSSVGLPVLPLSFSGFVGNPCLVESSGELLLVLRLSDFYWCRAAKIHQKTLKFCVFQLDWQRREWTELRSIGDRMIFVGRGQSICVAASGGDRKHPFWKGNCIYLADYSYGCCDHRDIVRFDLDDDAVYHLPDEQILESVFWFIHNV